MLIVKIIDASVASAFILSSILLYLCLKTLHLQSDQIWFDKRGPILLWLFLSASGIDTIVVFPLLILGQSRIIILSQEILNIVVVLFLFIGLFVENVLICRLFLQFINIRRAQESDDWRFAIDPKYKTSWVLKYYYIIGNPAKLLGLNLLFWCGDLIVCLVIVFIDNGSFGDSFDHRFGFLFVTILVLCLLQFFLFSCFAWNLNKSVNFDVNMDSLFIWKEFQLLFIVVMTIGTIGMGTALILSSISEISQTFDIKAMTLMPLCIVFMCSWYVQTIWVNKKNIKANINFKGMNIRNDSDSNEEQVDANSTTKSKKHINFAQTLQSSHS